MYISLRKVLLIIVINGAGLLGVAQKSTRKPNIIFILADDLGYESINPYGADKKLVSSQS